MPISFQATPAERKHVRKIAARYRSMQRAAGFPMRKAQEIVMDLLATNANGCRLDFDKMQAAHDFDIGHDVGGIWRHLDRDDNSPTAGKLLNCFRPRCALRPL